MSPGGNNPIDRQINAQILGTLQDIASVLRTGGRGGGGGGGGGGSIIGGAVALGGGGGGDLLAGLSRLTAILATLKLAEQALKSLADGAKAAAANLSEFANQQFGLASSAGTTAIARTLGRALGVGDVAALGAQIHAGTLSPFGIGVAGRYGIPYRPYEIGGATDRGEMLMKVIEGLRATARSAGMNQAIGEARTIGAESLLPATLLSDKTLQGLREHARLMETIFGPERLAAAVEFQVSMAKLEDTFDATKTLLLAGLIPIIEAVNQKLLHGLQILAGIGGASRSQIEAALNSHARELALNTRELQKLNGIYGGGAGARAAMPAAGALQEDGNPWRE
jgi:hypothetical protein